MDAQYRIEDLCHIICVELLKKKNPIPSNDVLTTWHDININILRKYSVLSYYELWDLTEKKLTNLLNS